MGNTVCPDSPPPYRGVVAAYNLEVLKGGADLVLTLTGSLELTKDGQLKMGDDKFNAMFRLAHGWRLNTPSLCRLFEDTKSAPDLEQALINELNAIGPRLGAGTVPASRLHALSDAQSANALGAAVYAGSIMVLVNDLLRRFEDDVKAPAGTWETTGPMVRGRSVGSIVQSAANNFRHYREWSVTNPPTSQQLPSIRVISDVLQKPITPSGAGHPFRMNVCREILDVLSGGNFEEIGRKIFEFAKTLTPHRDGCSLGLRARSYASGIIRDFTSASRLRETRKSV